MRRLRQRCDCRPALRISRSLTTRVFLELYSGSARLGRAVANLGYPVLLWDLALGAEYDLLLSENRNLIRGWLLAGLLLGVHQGIPCNSWSRARDIPGGRHHSGVMFMCWGSQISALGVGQVI